MTEEWQGQVDFGKVPYLSIGTAIRAGTMFDVSEQLVSVLFRCRSYCTGEHFMSA